MAHALPEMDTAAPAELVKLETLEQYQEEGNAMKHGVHAFFNLFQRQGTVVYSVRQHGASVLTTSVKEGSYTDHIVGISNRRPTPEELEAVTSLLQKIGVEVRYNPATMY